jgi:hypothetical protein
VLSLSGDNLTRLQTLCTDLQANVVAVPPFASAYLQRGHFIHFRCRRADVDGVRIDVAGHLRGVAPFDQLWARRQTFDLAGVGAVDVIGLPDLVASKKTQRDKDWVMIRRLMEVDYFTHRAAPAAEQVEFWLRELRTPELLVALASAHDALVGALRVQRPLLGAARGGDAEAVEKALGQEMERERADDRAHWEPLRRELAALRGTEG